MLKFQRVSSIPFLEKKKKKKKHTEYIVVV